MKTTALQHITFVLLLLGLCGAHLLPRQRVLERERDISFNLRDDHMLPPAEGLRALTLNYTTFAASMTWIAGLVYFGDWRMSPHSAPPQHLRRYADAIVALDQDFYEVYPWFVSVQLNSNLESGAVPHKELVEASEFLMRGAEHFPQRYELPYMAGLNFVGYSKGRSNEVRLKEYELGERYLEACLRMDECPAVIALTTAYMRDQQSRLARDKTAPQAQPKLSQEELDTYIDVFRRTNDPQLKERVEELLVQENIDVEALKATDAQNLLDHFKQDASYLPLDLWILLSQTDSSP